MRTEVFFGMLFVAFFAVAGLTACSDNDEEERKVTGYKEYTFTVASAKLPGVLPGYGTNVLADVLAVKKEPSAEWEAQDGIGGFEYEEGYEYRIRVGETSYLDYRMGDSAWTEYELLEVLSKERKVSENLPLHFVPDWYFEDRCMYIDPEFAYAVDADKKEDVENDLKSDDSYRFGGLRYYVAFPADKWFLLDADMQTKGLGTVIRKSVEPTEFPDTYRLLMPEQQVVGYGQYDFVANAAPETPVMQYDGLICRQFTSRSAAPAAYTLWLYRDLTAYYRSKYPEANVKAVVIRYVMKN